VRLLRYSVLISLPVGVLIGVACKELTAPAADRADVAAGVTPSLELTATPPDPIFPVQLRAHPPDPILPVSQDFGLVQLSFLTIPANPIIPTCVITLPSTTAGMTAAAICGQIHNPDLQTLVSGILFQGSLEAPSASVGIGGFSFDVQTTPCSRITLQGTLLLPDAFATAFRTSPSSFSLAFSSLEHPLAALVGSFGPAKPGGLIDVSLPLASGVAAAGSVAEAAPSDVVLGGCTVTLHSF
jgi:hypothetical protein